MSTDLLRIEKATEEDIPLILGFVRKLAEYERLSHTVTVDEERLRNAMFGPNAVANSVIAYRDNQPVAFAIYYFTYASFSGLPGLYLEDLFVHPHVRGTGVGKEMFRYLAKRAMERGCGRMEWAVLNWNESAIRFYRNLGAESVEGWTIFRLSQNQLSEMARQD